MTINPSSPETDRRTVCSSTHWARRVKLPDFPPVNPATAASSTAAASTNAATARVRGCFASRRTRSFSVRLPPDMVVAAASTEEGVVLPQLRAISVLP